MSLHKLIFDRIVIWLQACNGRSTRSAKSKKLLDPESPS
jgi:hypothetical protein